MLPRGNGRMIFVSFFFVCWFLPAFLAGYGLLPPRARNLWLTAASFVFYGWWRPTYVFLMVGSTALDYVCARALHGTQSVRKRRAWLWVSVVSNLALLGYFKYANFFVDSWNGLGLLPVEWGKVLLPVGISFYTFQSMSYTIDVYRGEVKPTRSFVDLLCYVTMFPQLVAGPIVRYRDVQQQITGRTHSLLHFSDGVFLFALGFAKKVLVADQVAPLADAAFGMAAPGLLAAWIGTVAFAVQIYFDFSGYSDMAIGLGRMLGFHFPSNFVSPYKAHSITEFWRRWHVSLSTWLRDYLYVPLGGNRKGPSRTYVNLALTMLLGGLWHGAAWTFVLWGGWQATWLMLERRLGKAAPYGFLPRPLQVACTFVLVLFGWAIFKASDLSALAAIAGGMFGLRGLGAVLTVPLGNEVAYAMLLLGLGIAFGLPRSEDLVARFRPLVMLGTVLVFVLALCHLFATKHSPFLYFQF